MISNNTEVTDCGKRFDLATHIYGYQINTHDISLMKEIYPIEGTDYIIWGKMKTDLFEKLISCIKNSKTVSRKYLRMLQ